MALEPERPLLAYEQAEPVQALDDAVHCRRRRWPNPCLPTTASTGLTLRAHPLALLRDVPPFDRCKRQRDLDELNDGRFVRVPGLVTCRQRPGTASGVLFLTLEDETGNNNVVVWPACRSTAVRR
jgi:error-prone DNA polymerase